MTAVYIRTGSGVSLEGEKQCNNCAVAINHKFGRECGTEPCCLLISHHSAKTVYTSSVFLFLQLLTHSFVHLFNNKFLHQLQADKYPNHFSQHIVCCLRKGFHQTFVKNLQRLIKVFYYLLTLCVFFIPFFFFSPPVLSDGLWDCFNFPATPVATLCLRVTLAWSVFSCV